MKAKFIIFFALLIFLLNNPTQISAEEKTSNSSANLEDAISIQGKDTRGIALQKYLQEMDSPLAPYADLMIQEADKNSIPWDLVAAISGTEGTFGKFQPTPTCNNTWGWGIFGNNTLCFNSYIEAIQTISKELKTRFMDKYGCKTIEDIGKFYASSNTWAQHTTWFMHKIEDYKENFDRQYLSISL